MCSLSLQLIGEGKGRVLREGGNLQRPNVQSMESLEVEEKSKPSIEARVG